MILFERNDIFDLDKQMRKFDKMFSVNKGKGEKNSMSEDDARKELEKLYNSYSDTFNDIRAKFKSTIEKTIPSKIRSEVEFLHQVKSMSSVIDKVVDRGKSIFSIADLVRGALPFPDADSTNKWVSDFRRKNKSMISKYEFKGKGDDPKYGYYGSHHIDLNIDGLDVELQVMPKKLWTYKDAAHGIYDKWRSSPTGKPSPEDKQRSFDFFFRGNKPKFKRESVERLRELIREIIRRELRVIR